MKKKCIQIYDTSLRDGTQGMSINYTLEDKLQIAKQLDNIHIDYIEGGFPLSSEKEARFFREIKKQKIAHSKIAAFGSTARKSNNTENDPHIKALLEAETDVVTIVVKSSSSHVKDILHISLEENLRLLNRSLAVFKKHNKEIILDLEHFFDGYKINPKYALKVLQVGTQSGADILILCDTNGGTLPHEVKEIMDVLPHNSLAPIGGHFHNDCELSVANSLTSMHSGAIQIQGTINGWGERTGNANLCSIIPNIVLKEPHYTAKCAPYVKKITSLSHFVAEIANIIPDTRQAFVGNAAFSHKAGQHADVILKNEILMEHIPAESVGNQRKILISELAGKSTLLNKMKKYGSFSKSDSIVTTMTKLLKEKVQQGYEYEVAEASFDLEILKALKKYTPLIKLKNSHIEMYKSETENTKTICKIYLNWHNTNLMGVAVGAGPVETIDRALRNALEHHCTFISTIKLTDYRVRVVNPEGATKAKVRVFITSSSNDQSWHTIGVNENIIEASWTALVDSYEYYYNCIQGIKKLK